MDQQGLVNMFLHVLQQYLTDFSFFGVRFPDFECQELVGDG